MRCIELPRAMGIFRIGFVRLELVETNLVEGVYLWFRVALARCTDILCIAKEVFLMIPPCTSPTGAVTCDIIML